MALLELSMDVAYRLRRLSLKAKRVEVGIRDSALKYYTFQSSLSFSSTSPLMLAEKGIEFFREKYAWEDNVRLVSIKAVDLVPLASSSYQLDILDDFKFKDRQEAIAKVLVGLRERFGGIL